MIGLEPKNQGIFLKFGEFHKPFISSGLFQCLKSGVPGKAALKIAAQSFEPVTSPQRMFGYPTLLLVYLQVQELPQSIHGHPFLQFFEPVEDYDSLIRGKSAALLVSGGGLLRGIVTPCNVSCLALPTILN